MGDKLGGGTTIGGYIVWHSGMDVDGRDVSVDGDKLDNIEDNANNYSHPATHSIEEISGLQEALDNKETLGAAEAAAASAAIAMAIALG